MAETVVSDGFEISSNHETAEAMTAALAPPPAGETVAETGAPTASEAPETPAAAAPDKPAKPRDDPRARVEAATAKEAQAKRERDEARAEAARYRDELDAARRASEPKLAEKPAETQQAAWKRFQAMPDAPKMSDFEGETAFEDWQAAKTLFIAEKLYEERRGAEYQQAQAQRVQQSEATHFQSFQAKLQAAIAEDPDFLDKVDKRLTETPRVSALPPHVRPTFGNFLVEQIYRSDAPKDLLLHFTAHPEDVQRLSTLHPTQVVREMGKLEAKLATPAAPEKTGTAVAPPKSQAKPPIQPVKGSSQAASDEPPGDDASDEAHDAYWAKQRKRFRTS